MAGMHMHEVEIHTESKEKTNEDSAIIINKQLFRIHIDYLLQNSSAAIVSTVITVTNLSTFIVSNFYYL